MLAHPRVFGLLSRALARLNRSATLFGSPRYGLMAFR
jgi:hypothetical protein